MSHWLLHYSFFKCNNSSRSNFKIKWDIHRIITRHLLRLHLPPLLIKFIRKTHLLILIIIIIIIINTIIIIIIISLISNRSSSCSSYSSIKTQYRSSSSSSRECITTRAFRKDKSKINKSINRQKITLCIILFIISSRNCKNNRINRYENILHVIVTFLEPVILFELIIHWWLNT